jgi:GxxExxY protein
MPDHITQRIIGTAMRVHSTLGPGFLESVYHKAPACELQRRGLAVESEKPIVVRYEDVVVGEFAADLLVEETVLLELKAVQTLLPGHEVQLGNYLTATGIGVGLLLNFGAPNLQFKRKARQYRPSDPTPRDENSDSGAEFRL